LDCAYQFTYLSGDIAKDGDAEIEVNTQPAEAATVLRRLSNVPKSAALGVNTEQQLCAAVVLATALYASETWKRRRKILKKLDVFQQRNL